MVQASPLDLFGQGAQSAGRGGVGAVTAVDGEALGANPSGVAADPVVSLSIGTMFGSIELEADGSPRTATEPKGTKLSIVMPIRLNGWANKRFVLGVSAYLPSDNLVKLSYAGADTPNFTMMEQRTQMTDLSASLAFSIVPSLRIGAGASAVLALDGMIQIESNGFGGLDTVAEQNVVIDAAPIVGIQWEPVPSLRLGAAYRGELAAKYDIDFTAATDPSFPLPLPDLKLRGVGQYEPRHASFGGEWAISPMWRLFAEVTYLGWGSYPRPAETLTPETLSPLPAPNFSDTVLPRLGIDATFRLGQGTTFRDSKVVVRTGYAFVQSPAPDAPAQQAILDNDRHVVGVGLGLSTYVGDNRLWIDVWAQMHEMTERLHPRLGESFVSDGRIRVGGLMVGATL